MINSNLSNHNLKTIQVEKIRRLTMGFDALSRYNNSTEHKSEGAENNDSLCHDRFEQYER